MGDKMTVRFPVARTNDGHWHVYAETPRRGSNGLGPVVALPNVTTFSAAGESRPVMATDVADLGRISRDRALAIRDAIADLYFAGWYDGRDSERPGMLA